MIQAKGSGYAMSMEDELESIRQVALQTGGLVPLAGPAQEEGGAAQCCTAQGGGGTAQYCTAQGGGGTADRWAGSPQLALQLAIRMAGRLPDLLRLPAFTVQGSSTPAAWA